MPLKDPSTTTSWNGPICGVCGTRWLGSHTCSNADILRRIAELVALLKPEPAPVRNGLDIDPRSTCPCRPENGGSGICGCILAGPKVTC